MTETLEVIRSYIDAPYSIEALSVEEKEVIVTDKVDLTALPHVGTGFLPVTLKRTHGEVLLTEQPEAYRRLHTEFCGAAREIIGDELFNRARIYFDHWYRQLREGEVKTFGIPHLDGCAPGGFNDPALNTVGESGAALKMVGMVFNNLPTLEYQGSTRPSDYEGEAKTHLKPSVVSRLDVREAPVNRISLAPPSLPHAAQRATKLTDRHFLRWQLMIDL